MGDLSIASTKGGVVPFVLAPQPPHLPTVVVLFIAFFSGYWVWTWLIWLLNGDLVVKSKPNRSPEDRSVDEAAALLALSPGALTPPGGALRGRGRAASEPIPMSPPLASPEGPVRFR